MPSTYNLISSQTLSSSASSVTFSSIPQTYTDLVLKVSARSSYSQDYDYLGYKINGLSTTIYSDTSLSGNGSSVGFGQHSSQTIGGDNLFFDASTATTNTFGSTEIYIPNYTNSAYKPVSLFSVQESNSSSANIGFEANLLSSSAAITSIVLTTGYAANFVQYSRFDLYGIKSS